MLEASICWQFPGLPDGFVVSSLPSQPYLYYSYLGSYFQAYLHYNSYNSLSCIFLQMLNRYLLFETSPYLRSTQNSWSSKTSSKPAITAWHLRIKKKKSLKTTTTTKNHRQQRVSFGTQKNKVWNQLSIAPKLIPSIHFQALRLAYTKWENGETGIVLAKSSIHHLNYLLTEIGNNNYIAHCKMGQNVSKPKSFL